MINISKRYTKRGKEVLTFFFRPVKNKDEYELGYKLNINHLKRVYINNEYNIVITGLGAIFKRLYKVFSIIPDNEKLGFDEELLCTISKDIVDKNEKDFEEFLKATTEVITENFKQSKKLLTNSNINVIINYYDSLDEEEKNLEHFVVLDSTNNKILVPNNDTKVNDSKMYYIKLSQDDIIGISKLGKPFLIHNHSDNNIFSENDKLSFKAIRDFFKENFGKPLNFLVYNVKDKSLTDFDTGDIFYKNDDIL